MQRKNASISEKKGLKKKDSERKAPEKLVTVFWFRYNEEADESRKKYITAARTDMEDPFAESRSSCKEKSCTERKFVSNE